ncbi:MAG: signal recognition particle-docking protein FtsY [Gammaproteobacteria bacterium]
MYRKLTLLSLIVALCVVVFGAYVRLTGAALSCPDWPGCYGQAVPKLSSEFIAQAQQAFPDRPLEILKAWKVMAQRYLAALLGVLVLLLALLSWRERQCRVAAVMSCFGLLMLLGLQASFSWLSVKTQLLPVAVVGQLLSEMTIFWLLFWLYLRANPAVVRLPASRGPQAFAGFAMLLLVLQITLGIWTSSTGAGMVCGDFPQCSGRWWPPADYAGAFRHLLEASNASLSGDARVAVQWLHRVGGVVVFVALSILTMRAAALKEAWQINRGALLLSVLMLLQIGLGIAAIRLSLPLRIVVLHNAFAALLMLPLIYIRFYSRYGAKAGEVPVEEEVQLPPVAAKPVAEAEAGIYVEKSPETLYLRLKSQLRRSRAGLGQIMASIPLGQKNIDADLLEEIETGLLMADVGVDATAAIIAQLTDSLERHQLNDSAALSGALKQQLLAMLEPCDQPLQIPQQDGPFVILVVGVNGVGKTTTIGKLAKRLQAQGHSVMLAAGDTFRAAAVEQLQTWGERNNIQVVAQHTGADSASVIFDGVQSALAKGVDVLIADTAGRLHTKSNLMDELRKIKRIMSRLDDTAPHEVLLVLDAGTGQNALSQARIFNEAVALTGIALTKLDGTAKGGVIFALAKQFGIPIRFIGVGEGIDDLQDFHAAQFVDALLATDE